MTMEPRHLRRGPVSLRGMKFKEEDISHTLRGMKANEGDTTRDAGFSGVPPRVTFMIFAALKKSRK